MTFQDGSPLTADDVVCSLDEARSETGASAEDFASISAVTAVDDATVGDHARRARQRVTYNLTRRGGAVVQADATDLESSANGTGPFRLTDWSVGSSITLERFDDYWGDPAAVAEVTFLYFTEPNAAVNALTTGDADILTGVNTDLVGPLEDDPAYVVNQGTTNGEVTLGFNDSKAPLDDQACGWRSARPSTSRACSTSTTATARSSAAPCRRPTRGTRTSTRSPRTTRTRPGPRSRAPAWPRARR